MIGIIPLLIVLIATVIGIPLVPIVILIVATTGVFGTGVLLYGIGQWIPLFKGRKGVVSSMLLGFVPFALITAIPVLGGVFLLLAGLVAMGATLLSRFGSPAADE
jgi:hypothetical protein